MGGCEGSKLHCRCGAEGGACNPNPKPNANPNKYPPNPNPNPNPNINHKWHHFMKAVRITKADSNSLKARVARVAQRCSYFMYCNRKNKEWPHPPLIESFKE